MDNQPPTPPPLPGMHPASPTQSMNPVPVPPLGGSGGMGSGSGPGLIMYALIGILGIGAVIFAVTTVLFYNKAQTAETTLTNQVSQAVTGAKADQKKSDDAASVVAAESPFRSYIAPVADGSFQINFPKSWSGYVDEESSGTQVSLVLNPDFVRRSNDTDELAGAKVQLFDRPASEYMQTYTGNIQRGTIKQNSITVSGQTGYDLTGTFNDQRTTRMVIIPVRDKVLAFINENSQYASEFNEILAQSRIIP